VPILIRAPVVAYWCEVKLKRPDHPPRLTQRGGCALISAAGMIGSLSVSELVTGTSVPCFTKFSVFSTTAGLVLKMDCRLL